GIEHHLAAFLVTFAGEGSLGMERFLRDSPDGNAPTIRATFELGTEIRAADYVRAQQYRRLLYESVDRALDGVDALVTPAMRDVAWRWDELHDVDLGILGFLAPFDLTGHPALSLPAPADGLPVGFHLVDRFGQDERLLDVVAWIE